MHGQSGEAKPVKGEIVKRHNGSGGFPMITLLLGTMLFRRRARAHAEELRKVATLLGLNYEEGVARDSAGQRPGAPLFERWVQCENRLSGTVDGSAAAMFDLTTIEGTGESERKRDWTVILFAQTHLPFFVCVPRRTTTWAERASLTRISFDPTAENQMTRMAIADFEKAYVLGVTDNVSAATEEPIRRHFASPRLEALAQCPNWHIQSAGGLLVFALSWTAPAADRPALWQEALELRQALLAPLASDAAPVPAVPGMDVGRQRNRRGGHRAGAMVGAVVGFFGSFIAAASLLAGQIKQIHRFGTALGLAFPFIVLGGLIVGVLTGRWLGGLVADLRYSSTADEPPPSRIHKGWVAAGALLGWIAGGAFGMGLSAIVNQRAQASWLMPIHFFAPPVLFLILGGCAGQKLARRRTERKVEE